jgi:tol-pal system protein YbgF
MGGLLAGCVAQEADLRQAERDLQKKIKQSNEELAQTRARQNQEITNLREQELPKLEGKIEVAAKQAEVLSHAQEDLKTRAAGLDKRAAELEKRLGWAEKTLVEQDNLLKAQDNLLKSERERVRAELTGEVGKASTRLDILQKSVESLAQKIDARLDEQQKTMRAGEAKAGALSHQIETQNKSIQDQVVKLTIALADFKLGLSAVNDRLGQQDQAIKHLQTSLEQEASASAKRTDALSAKVDADTKAATAHINEVNRALMGHVAELNKSVTSVAKALETAGGKFMARIDDQDHRLESLSKNLEQLRDSSRARQRQGGTKPAPRAGMIPAGETTTQSGSATSSGDDEDTASTSEAKAAEGDSSASPVAAAGEKTDREAYEQVLAKFKDGNMEGAREGFAKFLDDYPNSTLAPNARYWLGESYYSQKDYKHAIDSYSRVERDYPQSEKVPAAILKKGFAYLALKDRKQASTAFKRVMTLYPKSSEAGKASDKLTQLERAR